VDPGPSRPTTWHALRQDQSRTSHSSQQLLASGRDDLHHPRPSTCPTYNASRLNTQSIYQDEVDTPMAAVGLWSGPAPPPAALDPPRPTTHRVSAPSQLQDEVDTPRARQLLVRDNTTTHWPLDLLDLQHRAPQHPVNCRTRLSITPIQQLSASGQDQPPPPRNFLDLPGLQRIVCLNTVNCRTRLMHPATKRRSATVRIGHHPKIDDPPTYSASCLKAQPIVLGGVLGIIDTARRLSGGARPNHNTGSMQPPMQRLPVSRSGTDHHRPTGPRCHRDLPEHHSYA
jgi:hypothetical protein